MGGFVDRFLGILVDVMGLLTGGLGMDGWRTIYVASWSFYLFLNYVPTFLRKVLSNRAKIYRDRIDDYWEEGIENNHFHEEMFTIYLYFKIFLNCSRSWIGLDWKRNWKRKGERMKYGEKIGKIHTRWKELFTEKSSARFAERLIEKYKVQRYRTFRDNARPKFIML